jgi:predicted ATPase with chaperone activity
VAIHPAACGLGSSDSGRGIAAQLVAAARQTPRLPRVAGLTRGRPALVMTCSFRAPHHTISDVGVIGGGPRPLSGKVSLAHHGLLWLDAPHSKSLRKQLCSHWAK